MTKQLIKGAVLAELKIPVWGLMVAILLGCVNVGVTYQQFLTLKEQSATATVEFKAVVAVLQEQVLKVSATDIKLAQAQMSITALDGRITTIEQFLLNHRVK